MKKSTHQCGAHPTGWERLHSALWGWFYKQAFAPSDLYHQNFVLPEEMGFCRTAWGFLGGYGQLPGLPKGRLWAVWQRSLELRRVLTSDLTFPFEWWFNWRLTLVVEAGYTALSTDLSRQTWILTLAQHLWQARPCTFLTSVHEEGWTNSAVREH